MRFPVFPLPVLGTLTEVGKKKKAEGKTEKKGNLLISASNEKH